MAFALMREGAKVPVASRVEIAVSRRARRRGLLGRQRLDSNAALVLVPCAAVHTACMRFPIDVVFVNREGRAVHIVARMQPWRIAIAPSAHAVIELAAGSVEKHDLRVGDVVRLVGDGPELPEEELQKVRECLELRAS
jgi:uncharacterized membrane protein (UPF0127 family)